MFSCGIWWLLCILVLVNGNQEQLGQQEVNPEEHNKEKHHRHDITGVDGERDSQGIYHQAQYHGDGGNDHVPHPEQNGQDPPSGIQDQSEKVTEKQKSDSAPGTVGETKEKLQDVANSSETGGMEDGGGNQSYFSFGNIIRKIVDPVFEEFKNNSTENMDEKDSVTVASELMPVANESDSTKNETVTDEVPDKNRTDKKTKFRCTGKNVTLENITAVVQIINNTKLLSMLNFDKNLSMSDCIVVMFYVPWCGFCAKTAPNYNALARAFPQLDIVAVDAAQFSNLNAKFGTVSVPNILLFHQSRTVVRFNQTDKSFDNLVSFIKNATGLEPNTTVNVTQEDYLGPLSSVPAETTDYLLLVAWVFVLVCSSIMFVQSNHGQQWINKVKILWQEHQHIE